MGQKISVKLITVFLLFISCVTTSKRRKWHHKQIITRTLSEPKAIIFDLSEVLFKENKSAFIEKIGFVNLAICTIKNGKSPGQVCLDMLEKMSREKQYKPTVPAKFKGRIMPRCIVEWQQGYKTCNQVRNEIIHYIAQLDEQQYFSSDQEKEITQKIIKLIFDPKELSNLTKPIIPMIRLAQQLKDSGYKLYVLSNIPEEVFTAVNQTHKEILDLFDGILISGQIKMVKPEKKIFTYFLKKYKLQADECILIDREENITIAREAGITGIVYNRASIVARKLRELGVQI